MKQFKFTKAFSIILTLSFLFMSLGIPNTAFASYIISSEDKYKEPIAEGVEIEYITQHTNEGLLKIYVMKVDLSNPYVKVGALTGKEDKLTGASPITEMVSNSGAIAGTNGDFFQMDEKAPLSLTVQEGEIVSSPSQRSDMYGFGVDGDNNPMIKIFGFQGQVQAENGATFPLYGINKPTYLAVYGSNPDVDKLNLYTPRWGEKSRGKLAGLSNMVELLVENDTVKEVRVDQPGVTIPQNGYVLAAHGKAAEWVKTNLPANSKLKLDYQILPNGDKLQTAIGGQAMLVNYGKRSWFTQNIKGKKARTAVGYTEDHKTMFLVVVEGGSTSRGMTQEELADFMVGLGCWQALNLDGGGSSTMATRMLGEENISLVNRPVYVNQRAVPNGLGIFTTAPKGDFAGLKIRGDRFVLVGASRGYTAKGYDEHYNPYHIDPEDISWSVEPKVGSFSGNVLTTNQSGQVTITATARGISENYDINILGADDIDKIQIIPSVVEINEGDSLKFKIDVKAKNGMRLSIGADEVDWEVTGDVGDVKEGVFTAVDKKSTGQLIAEVAGKRITVPVSVGSVEKAYSGLDAFNNYQFKGFPTGVGGSFQAADLATVFRGTGAARLKYDFTNADSTSAAYGNFGENGLTLPGHPLGLGVWVNGKEGNNHWLRAKITEANGKTHLIDLARHIDWDGWKHVTGKFPSNLSYPIKLNSIYVVETDTNKFDKGQIYIDELTLLMPITEKDLSATVPVAKETFVNVNVDSVTTANLGVLDVRVPEEGLLAERLKLSEQWSLEIPTPGYDPVMPAFNIMGETAMAEFVAEATGPYDISIKYTGKADLNQMRLMRWDNKKRVWVALPQKADSSTKIISAKANKFGLFALMEDKVPAFEFKDINDSWAKNKINEMAAKKVVSGFPGNKFFPNKGVTRAEFVVLLAKTFGWSAPKETPNFKDELPTWAEEGIGAAVNQGAIAGYGDGTFQPNKMITRAEMAVIINNCLAISKSATPSGFDDGNEIPVWAVQAVRNTKESGLMRGSGNKFRPGDTATRAEATVVLDNMLNYYLR